MRYHTETYQLALGNRVAEMARREDYKRFRERCKRNRIGNLIGLFKGMQDRRAYLQTRIYHRTLGA
jgi:hypothetical protein